MIRSFEKTNSTSKTLSARATRNGRIPIFAVSASLVEREREKYIEAGFDGWILKPVDFKQVKLLMTGIEDASVRDSCVYQPGKWEQGGWFRRMDAEADSCHVKTTPSGKSPTAQGDAEAERDSRPPEEEGQARKPS